MKNIDKVIHAPGPGQSESYIIERFQGAEDHDSFMVGPFFKNKKDAQMYSAAPDLLEALINLCNEVEHKCSLSTDPEMLDMLRFWLDAKGIIKKATS